MNKLTWHKIAESVLEINFSEAGLAEIEVAGKKICIARHKEQLFACAAKCPHAGGPMSAGYVDALGNIVCPLHRYKFSLSRGHNVTGEGYYLKTFPVREEDGIWLQC